MPNKLTLFDVPGFKESWENALAGLYRRRDLSWFSGSVCLVCNLPCRPISLAVIMDMIGSKNPILNAKQPLQIMPQDVVLLLYRLSPDYREGEKDEGKRKKKAISKHLKKMKLADIQADVFDFVKCTFEDLETGGAGDSGQIKEVSFCAYYVNALASNYGWTDDHILNMPFERVIQLTRLIAKKNNPDHKFSFPDTLQKLQARGLRELRELKQKGHKDGA